MGMTEHEAISDLTELKICGVVPFTKGTISGGNYKVITEECLDKAIDTMRKYQKIIDKYEMLCDSFIGLDGETVTKKIDEFCIDTMRGLLGEHYSDALHEVVEDGKID